MNRPHGISDLEASVSAEEVRQLDLLLGELAQNERHLTPTYWANRAQVFTDHVALLESGKRARRTARLGQLKPYLMSTLPLGGLIALGVALTSPTVSPVTPVATNETTSMVVAATAIEAIPDDVNAPAHDQASSSESTSRAHAIEPADNATPAHEEASRKPKAKRRSARALDESTAKPAAEPTSTTASAAPVQPAPPVRETQVRALPANDTPAPDTFSEQLLALKRADKALKSGDNAEAKKALARAFSPQLTPHAKALRAVLACQSGDPGTGKRYLDSEVKNHPNSPYLDRMRRACRVTPESVSK